MQVLFTFHAYSNNISNVINLCLGLLGSFSQPKICPMISIFQSSIYLCQSFNSHCFSIICLHLAREGISSCLPSGIHHFTYPYSIWCRKIFLAHYRSTQSSHVHKPNFQSYPCNATFQVPCMFLSLIRSRPSLSLYFSICCTAPSCSLSLDSLNPNCECKLIYLVT